MTEDDKLKILQLLPQTLAGYICKEFGVYENIL